MATDTGPSNEQKREFIQTTRAKLVDVREKLYGSIDHINLQLEKLDLAQAQIDSGEKNVSVPYLTPMPDPVDESMARHPAGKKRRIFKP